MHLKEMAENQSLLPFGMQMSHSIIILSWLQKEQNLCLHVSWRLLNNNLENCKYTTLSEAKLWFQLHQRQYKESWKGIRKGQREETGKQSGQRNAWQKPSISLISPPGFLPVCIHCSSSTSFSLLKEMPASPCQCFINTKHVKINRP